MFSSSAYRSEFSIKEPLLDAGPESDGNDKELLLAEHLFEGGHLKKKNIKLLDVENIEGGHQQLQPGQLILVLLLIRDPKLLQRVNKKSNQNSCSYGTTKEDPHDDVDLVDVNIKVPVERIHLLFWRRFWFWVALTV